jgi:phosphatidylethanolamine-binding protein (PEBP) family uncharacterized protein
MATMPCYQVNLIGVSLEITCSLRRTTLQNNDMQSIKSGDFLTEAQVFNGFGCSGKTQSPALKWSGAPEGTKSFAITVYDPCAIFRSTVKYGVHTFIQKMLFPISV